MSKYASGTTVTVESSISELRRTIVTRYKAEGFSTAEDATAIGVRFRLNGRQVCLTVPLPDPEGDEFKWANKQAWRQRTAAQRKAAYDAEVRRLWRVLLLIVKTKMELVEAGQEFDTEWMPYLELPNGMPVAKYGLPQVLQAIENGGGAPALLPSFGKGE